MSKIKDINFSRLFPADHERAGDKTYFVESILTFMSIAWKDDNYLRWLIKTNPDISEPFLRDFVSSLSLTATPKGHTIRDHKVPINAGDIIRPKCWAGNSYNKTKEGYWKIQFCPNILVKKVWKIYFCKQDEVLIINDVQFTRGYYKTIKSIANNDGLDINDFYDWFKKPFNGHIICWDNNIKY